MAREIQKKDNIDEAQKNSSQMYSIRIEVEFVDGEQAIPLTWKSESLDWKYVPSTDGSISIGTEHFGANMRVPDFSFGQYDAKNRKFKRNIERKTTSKASIVIVVESPHKHELTSREPLSNKNTREKFFANILAVCSVLGVHRSVDVVVVNPIQWQASLAALYVGKPPNGMAETVRNQVWRHIWDYVDEEGSPAQRDFLTRLNRFHPVSVINACTSSLSDRVSKALDEYNNVFRTTHPSSWPLPLRITRLSRPPKVESSRGQGD